MLPTIGVTRPSTPDEQRQVRRAGQMVLGGWVANFVGTLICIYCLLRSWYLFFTPISADCFKMRRWLLVTSMSLTALPFCYMLVLPIVICLAISGRRMEAQMQDGLCEREAPLIWGFPDFILGLLCPSALLALTASVLLTCAFHHLRGMASTRPSVVVSSEVLIEEVCKTPLLDNPGEECAICLLSDDEVAVVAVSEGHEVRDVDAGRKWRSLPCLHLFHDVCLRRWLSDASVCPLCRLDLVDAYMRRGQRRRGWDPRRLRNVIPV
eukprot:CAMPEP_0194515714 /NCGR_PEP_ID=MMETSP0253-20130528/48461_1 /TAXON_ID=2966 /ORGANISM="Noctiluca scintillans" /LENGTH=265 /DNA_ID=CAMNT_0039359489 /DNA_START=117 /DNA_END=914 /DNA_ORIENTATION=-